MWHKYNSLVKKAISLNLQAKNIADGMRSGMYRSMYSGRGIEFAGVRNYLRGDDVRSIDWNVTARMGKPFVKCYEEERELIVFLIVDRSLSMESSLQGHYTRLDTATEAAALVLLAAQKNASPVGGVLFSGGVEYVAKPKNDRNSVMRLFYKLDTVPNRIIQGTALPQALRGATKCLKNRSLVMIFSDFRCAGYEKELAILGSFHDVVAVRITDQSDMELPSVGTLPIMDPESNNTMQLPTASRLFQTEWKKQGLEFDRYWKNICRKRGVTPFVLQNGSDTTSKLIQFFSHRESFR
jgi:uncharacterized protein (DUF58 family)